MVSNARLDLPDPDRPVITVRLSRGISTLTPLRLCSRAPRTEIWVCMTVSVAYLFARGKRPATWERASLDGGPPGRFNPDRRDKRRRPREARRRGRGGFRTG